MKNIPLISVCIPLYDTEPLLAQCLRSALLQDFDSFEVIVLSDASRGKDKKGCSAKKIIHLVEKECHKKVRFYEHRENMGLVEVRRSLSYYAQGKYVTFVDSDDVMEEGSLKALYAAAESNNADIVQGRSTSGFWNSEMHFIPTKENLYSKITIGKLCDYQIIKNWLCGKDISGVLWAKLIKKSVLEKAFESIPHIECNFAEDFLIFFFTSFYSKLYVGIEDKVYRYRVQSGMSSARKIDSLKKIRMICSTASVFTVISESEELKQLEENEINFVRRFASAYLADNIRQLSETVIPELQLQAREMLCEYWGASFVERVERSVKNLSSDRGCHTHNASRGVALWK